jgi:hypothetical protein
MSIVFPMVCAASFRLGPVVFGRGRVTVLTGPRFKPER